MRRQPTASLTFVALLLAAGVLLAPATAHAAQPNDPGMVKFRGAAFPIAEEAGAVTIVVKRLRGSSGEVTVDYATVPGSATEGDDYTATAGTLTWADGDGADKPFTVDPDRLGYRPVYPEEQVERDRRRREAFNLVTAAKAKADEGAPATPAR
jgi:hypothetical protein